MWRLGATLAMSLGAGLITHMLQQRGWLGQQVLRGEQAGARPGTWDTLRAGWRRVKLGLASFPTTRLLASASIPPAAAACCGGGEIGLAVVPAGSAAGPAPVPVSSGESGCVSNTTGSCGGAPQTWRQRLLDETWQATWMVVRFMALAFFLTALIELYVPDSLIVALLGRQNPWSILLAAGLGVPVYTSNLTALPMISGLLAQGMNPAAALAFLIAGPTTTLPAMAAVWGLVTRRVFVLYALFSLLGAVLASYVYFLATWL